MADGPRTRTGWDRVLGATSAVLAAPPLIAPGPVAALIGVDGGARNRMVLRAVGAREALAAAGLLSVPQRWMLWGRVVGDATDLALLGNALATAAKSGRSAGRFARTAAVTAVVAGITAADVYAAIRGRAGESTEEAVASVTVNRSREECFGFWRDLERLPQFMAHLAAVRVDGGGGSHWQAVAPFGRTVEWDAEIVSEQPGEEIAWRSVPGSAVRHEGSVRFRPAPDGGTEVRVRIVYGGIGPVGAAAARWAGEDPHQQLDDDLRRFKQVMETGEVVRSDGAPQGKRARAEFPQHPAQPAGRGEAA